MDQETIQRDQEAIHNIVADEEITATTAAPEVEVVSRTAVYDKSQSLVDIANNTFRELCKSLESEQTKLLELEEKRKNLQEEMLRLKAEIEEEKNFYHLNLTQSLSDHLKQINYAPQTTPENNEMNETKAEKEENMNAMELENGNEEYHCHLDTARNVTNSLSIEEHTNDIKFKLQTVLDQCIEEQSRSTEN